ncbi:uncharacterized protein LOC110651797 isoform X2 [Hevea brasiliensis]|uniref:uncharacterized protein LOC110651797 isoform X2 n=1 Tax=Hevea brasiliensis TaxID=3981 RepID=UPI0025E6D5F5|nr:uncharacterized protein LOC110651797 isoform X2 [Hevea brasiliensis]
MKALVNSSSWYKIAFQRNGDYRAFNPTTHEISSFRSKKFLNVGFRICFKHKPLRPISASTRPSLSADSKTDLELEEAKTKTRETHQSNTVDVKFHLKKECSFGEQFALVGDDQMFGMWDPENAIPLNWSDGHVWTLELDIPIGKSIQFKFILKEINGKILWQPGPDRIFKTWETKNTIVVSEDWEDATLQQLTEEESMANKKGEPTVNSEMLIVADELSTNSEIVVFSENLTHENEELISDVNSYPAKESLPSTPDKPIIADEIPPPEKEPLVIVADNITHTKEDPDVSAILQMPSGKGINHEKDENEANSNKEAMIAEEIVGNSGRTPTDMNLATINVEGNPVSHEGDPVLVPGLTPLSVFSSDPVTHDEVEISSAFDASVGVNEGEKSSAFDASVGVDEVKDNNLPESDEKHEIVGDPSQEEAVEVADDGKQKESESIENVVPQNDTQWGRKTIQKLLVNLGLL